MFAMNREREMKKYICFVSIPRLLQWQIF
uniref:Uncharacterized protein n=1 Tax=Anguilla anguilla TaxID=7936 RepID=A0A0E9T3Y0_ANGAN